MKIRNERLAAVATGAAIVVGLGSVTAVAADLVTSKDIKNNTIRSADIHDGTIKQRDLSDGTKNALKGEQGPEGPQGPPGDAASYQGENWSIVDRNTIGAGDAFLRAGPSVGAFGADQAPPAGVGSLGIRTASGTDRAAFGNQVDFAGDPLGEWQTVKYWVFTTTENEDVAAGNLPNISVEIDQSGPDSTVGGDYSSLVFVPESAAEGEWTELDASTAERWYLTGTAGTTSGCTQAAMCSLAEVNEQFPDASIHTVQISKGRDNAFSGAVDALTLNDTTYDFEPFGVTETSGSEG